ncbi:MAG: PEP-CTERM sorting domain-containing protein [Planctomycetota bacterium]|nr:MAG: PEP-CTERM sorting domain-containing protein [Planctomycetota bacterium]
MKTMAFAAVAGFAGLATASPFFSTAQTGTEIYSAPAGAVATITVDISGINSWDLAGSSFNETLSVSLGGDYLVTGIGWNVTIQALGASWRSEATIGFLDSPIGLQLTPGTDSSPGTGTYTSGGIVDLASIDPTFPFTVGADGNLDLEFFESFDDVSGAIDATYLAGSSLQIQYVVPAPGALAMLGLGGLVAGRRRR